MRNSLLCLCLLAVLSCNSPKSGSNDGQTGSSSEIPLPVPQMDDAAQIEPLPVHQIENLVPVENQMTDEEMAKALEGSKFVARIVKIQAQYVDLDGGAKSTTQVVDSSLEVQYPSQLKKGKHAYMNTYVYDATLEDSQETTINRDPWTSDVLHLDIEALNSDLRLKFSLYGDDYGFDDDIIENNLAFVPVREIVQAFGKSAEIRKYEKSFSFNGEKKDDQKNLVVMTVEFIRMSSEEYNQWMNPPAKNQGNSEENEYQPKETL